MLRPSELQVDKLCRGAQLSRVRELIPKSGNRLLRPSRARWPSGASGSKTQSVVPMTKTTDLLSEVLQDTKHPFRAVGDRQRKPQKHRYERRKARECLRLGDWQNQPD